MAEAIKHKKILAKQRINRRVMFALLPCVAGSIYFFGWRCLFMVIWAAIIAFVVEFIFTRHRKEPVSEAVFVTSTIFALIMPPTVGWHVLTIGVVFAIMFAKEVFGGFGRNIFNPAMAGRCFVYICFPIALTTTWSEPANGPWGALDRWTTAPTIDTVTSATPMTYLKRSQIILEKADDKETLAHIPFKIETEQKVHIRQNRFLLTLTFGRISGTAGVTSVLLILIGGAYLFYTKTASRHIILSLVITYTALNQVLYWLSIEPVPGALPAVLGGGFLFGAFFMATDPISAPKTNHAKVFYGILIAVSTTVIRNFSIFNGGLMFSILIGNMFAPILDHAVKAYKAGKTIKGAD